jgi:hypothetical protein
VESIDPAHLGSRVDPTRVLIFEAEREDCVPRSAREALWEALGRPTRIRLPTTHADAFLGLTFRGGDRIRYRIVEFMSQTLP